MAIEEKFENDYNLLDFIPVWGLLRRINEYDDLTFGRLDEMRGLKGGLYQFTYAAYHAVYSSAAMIYLASLIQENIENIT